MFRSSLTSFFAAFVLALTLLFTLPVAEAQAFQTNNPGVEYEDPFTLGTVDLTLTFGGLFYNWIEPGFDLGLIPISDLGVISVGAGVNAGYCLIGCGLLSFLYNPLRIRAWNVNPMGRALFHLNALGRNLNIRGLDVYGGLTAGVAFTNFILDHREDDTARLEGRDTSFLVGPVAGGRFTLSGTKGFFFYAEWRFLAEFGSSTISLQSGGQTFDQTDLISRGGSQTGFGGGFRF